MQPKVEKLDQAVLSPKAGISWAETMVLNPTIIDDPARDRIHMLFRATGPCEELRRKGKPLPYPISLGYAYSEDKGKTWTADFEQAALMPRCAEDLEELFVNNINGERILNHANGCIEDPRLFTVEGEVYVSVACRLFPPGPYWENDEPMQCAPNWASTSDHGLGRAAKENVTVNVLYRVNLMALRESNYDVAFTLIHTITNPEMGENRDAFFFSEKMIIEGVEQYVLLHRPVQPYLYEGISTETKPSMFISCAKELTDFGGPKEKHLFLAAPLFDWEDERVGASSPPIRISSSEWLLPYHGKKDAVLGYTQSFMILEEKENAMPEIKHRCSDRLFIADRDWELPQKFSIPCVFTTGAIVDGDDLIMSYGAADELCGVCRTSLQDIVAHTRNFDAQGQRVADLAAEAMA